MKKIVMGTVAVMVSLGLVACSTNTQQENTGIGVVTGAVAGGLLGSAVGGGVGKVVAVGAGALLGGYIGGQIGHSMDSSDTVRVYNTMDYTPTGRVVYWTNPGYHVTYRLVPVSGPYVIGTYHDCRKFRASAVMSNGHVVHFKGVACKRFDGSWVMM